MTMYMYTHASCIMHHGIMHVMYDVWQMAEAEKQKQKQRKMKMKM